MRTALLRVYQAKGCQLLRTIIPGQSKADTIWKALMNEFLLSPIVLLATQWFYNYTTAHSVLVTFRVLLLNN